jgi:hypothetical protein
LLILGDKQFETRSWKPTSGPGLLGITSSRRFPLAVKKLCEQDPFRSLLQRHNLAASTLPLGCLLGTVFLEEFLHTEDLIGTLTPSPRELSLGDFSPGRYAWRCSHPMPLAVPVPTVGRRGLFEIPIPAELAQE